MKPDPELWPRTQDFIKLGQHYNNAPVVEAILEFRVGPQTQATGTDVLEALYRDGGEYSNIEQLIDIEGRFEILKNDIKSQTIGRVVGYVYSRSDGRRSVTVTPDRFGFSWRDKYSDWNAFLREAEIMWLGYREAVEPVSITGVGVRFINQIIIPRESIEFKDYLRTSVDISPYLPQMTRNLFMQVEIPLPDYECISTITSALTPPPPEGGTSLVLDIDTRRTVNLPFNSPSYEDNLKQTMEALRQAKNFVFEACITDATRGLIQ